MTVAKSRFHSFTPKEAKEKRILALSAGYDTMSQYIDRSNSGLRRSFLVELLNKFYLSPVGPACRGPLTGVFFDT